ncbi:MAG: hypothetical protein RI903_856 [Bacteroidota bacterium]
MPSIFLELKNPPFRGGFSFFNLYHRVGDLRFVILILIQLAPIDLTPLIFEQYQMQV